MTSVSLFNEVLELYIFKLDIFPQILIFLNDLLQYQISKLDISSFKNLW